MKRCGGPSDFVRDPVWRYPAHHGRAGQASLACLLSVLSRPFSHARETPLSRVQILAAWSVAWALALQAPVVNAEDQECAPQQAYLSPVFPSQPFHGIELGSEFHIRLADIDADGDLDGFLSFTGSAFISYLKNVGSASAPRFVLAPNEENPFLDENGLWGGTGTASFADLDNDGDLDAVRHQAYFENEGTPFAPLFVEQTLEGHPLEGVAQFPHISFGDLDGDGDLDTLFHENQGNAQTPLFVERSEELTALPPAPADANSGHRFDFETQLVDLDADGDLDCVRRASYEAVDWSETLSYTVTYPILYTNIGNAQNPVFERRQTPPHSESIASKTLLEYADIDADGDMDIVMDRTGDSGIGLIYSIADCTPPLALCKDAIVPLNNSGRLVVTPDAIDAGSSDDEFVVWTYTSELPLPPQKPGCGGPEIVELTLYVSDLANTSSCVATVTAVDITLPRINLNGSSRIVLSCGDVYEDEGAEASDECAGVLTAQVSGAVNTSNPGQYELKFLATDPSGNTRSVSRRVLVKADCDWPEEEVQFWEQVLRGFTSSDTNGDALLSLAELTSAHPEVEDSAALFAGMDWNHDDALSVPELLQKVQSKVIVSADTDADQVLSLNEMLRVIQLYNIGGYICATSPGNSEDGFVPGIGSRETCKPHSMDSNGNGAFSLSELLRAVQLFNLGGYAPCDEGEDGFCGR